MFIRQGMHSAAIAIWLRSLIVIAMLLGACAVQAQTDYPLGANGWMGLGNRNGDLFIEQDDMQVKVPGGYVRINRDFDGRQWVFNRQWSGLGRPSFYKTSYPSMGAFFTCTSIDGINSCDTTASAGVQMTIDPPDLVIEQTRIPNDPYFGRDGKGDPVDDLGNLQFVARKGVGFNRSSDGSSFVSSEHPRFIVRPQSVLVLPVSAGPDAQPAPGKPGKGGLATSLVSGFRWTDRSGQWIEYDNFGRITSYGDRNDVRVWLQYGSQGQVERVLDDNGRTVFTLLYSGNGSFITEVRDHTPLDGSIRRVQYQYDDKGRLRHVIDVRGHTTSFDYGALDSVSVDTSTPVLGTSGSGGGTGSSSVSLPVDTRYKVTKVTDAAGRVTEIGYGVTARVSRITAPDMGVTDFEYGYDKLKKEFNITVRHPQTAGGRKVETIKFDQEGRPVYREIDGKTVMTTQGDGHSMTYLDERNGSTQVVRDNFDEISRITYADGTSRNYVYEAGSTDIREAVDEAGVKRQIRYDNHGNMLDFHLAAGKPEEQVTEYIYNSRGEAELMRRKGGVNPDGSTDVDVELRFTRDANGNVVQLLDGEGKPWKYEYDNLGNLTKATDPLLHVWSYTYDASGNLLSETDPNQQTVRYEYDATDLLTAMTDGRGHVTRYGYDDAGRGSSITDPYSATFTDRFDTAGQLISRTDAAGQTAALSYDAAGRLTKVVDGENFQTLLDYAESDGQDHGARQVAKVAYPTFQRLFRYDSRKRPVQQTELLADDSLTSGATHDPRGRIKTLTDANGHTQSFEYDGIGRLVASIDELGNTTRFAYDHRNNLVGLTNPRGKLTRMAYDRRGLLLTETNAVDQTTGYTYDDAGNLTEMRRPNGVRLVYHYDPAGRLDQRQAYRADASLEQTDHFSWDAADNLTGWSTDRASGVLAYDDADRLLSETVTIDGTTLKRAYSYYPNNKVKSYTGPDGVTLSYTYDKNGELRRLDIPGEGSISVTDWTWTAPKKIVLPGGTVQEMERDGLLELTRLRVKGPDQTTLFELENHFGHLREVGSRKVDGDLTRFEYDEALRLTKAQPDFMAGTSETYVVDKAGNRTEQSGVSGTWTYDDANRLQQRGNVNYDYDSAGNLIRKVDADLGEPLRTTRYKYDGYNRLIEVRDGADTVVASYAYDPFDNRLLKELSSVGAARSGTTAGKTLFLQGEEGLLAETAADGSVLRSYGWHPEHPYSTYPLFQHADGAYFYYHNDQLGTPWRVTNKAGAIVWSAKDYTAFGTAKVAAGAQIVQPWRLPGQYFDAETGLHYNLRRYYEPETGRYVSEDPLGLEAGHNFYAYARHSPTNFADPTGEFIACLAVNYLRCVATCSLIDGVSQAIQDPCQLGWNIVTDCMKDCLWDMLPIPNPCGRVGKWISRAIGIASAANDAYGAYQAVSNSFPGDTPVATPDGLKRIEDIRPGDKVLAYSEWQNKTQVEQVTDVMLSHREQTIVTITLSTGEKIRATGGHPLHTPSGWRAAQLLLAGGQLDVKGLDGKLRPVAIAKVEQAHVAIPVFNLEVANAHTFFIGEDGVLAHNGGKGRSGKQPRLTEMMTDDKLPSHVTGWLRQEANLIKCGKRKSKRVPPGYHMAHRRGYEAKDGFGYGHSDLQNPDLHRLQHKYEGY